MPSVVTSVSELGIGDYDGQPKLIVCSAERLWMRWNQSAGIWISDERVSIKHSDAWLTAVGTGGSGEWKYFTSAEGNPGIIGVSGFGWTPQAIHRADAAFAAGLVLQEKVDYLAWAWTAADNVYIATVFYDLDPGDVISTLISATAGDHRGVTVQFPQGVRKFQSSGWVNSVIPTPVKDVLAPHLYTMSTTVPLSGHAKVEYLTAFYRWIGDPTP